MAFKKLVENKLTEEPTLGDVAKAESELDAETVKVSHAGVIESTLDRALKANERIIRNGGDDYINILFVGPAGTGKTSRIRAWAKQNNINLFEVRAAGMDDTDLGGAITPSADNTTVNRLASTEFDKLDRPRSVLFLDEYNRAPQSVRTNLLELVNSHIVPDPREPSGQRKLKNFLFTVAAINPADSLHNTDTMDMAEKTRFKEVPVAADPHNLLQHLTSVFDRELAIEEDPEERLALEGRKKLAQTLLSNREFRFDNAADAEKTAESGNGLTLNNRTLTYLLNYCDGTKEDFLREWNSYCNNQKKAMAERILMNYEDVQDKANDALKGGTGSQVFGQHKKSYFEKIQDYYKTL